jgi:hypothetical protein
VTPPPLPEDDDTLPGLSIEARDMDLTDCLERLEMAVEVMRDELDVDVLVSFELSMRFRRRP